MKRLWTKRWLDNGSTATTTAPATEGLFGAAPASTGTSMFGAAAPVAASTGGSTSEQHTTPDNNRSPPNGNPGGGAPPPHHTCRQEGTVAHRHSLLANPAQQQPPKHNYEQVENDYRSSSLSRPLDSSPYRSNGAFPPSNGPPQGDFNGPPRKRGFPPGNAPDSRLPPSFQMPPSDPFAFGYRAHFDVPPSSTVPSRDHGGPPDQGHQAGGGYHGSLAPPTFAPQSTIPYGDSGLSNALGTPVFTNPALPYHNNQGAGDVNPIQCSTMGGGGGATPRNSQNARRHGATMPPGIQLKCVGFGTRILTDVKPFFAGFETGDNLFLFGSSDDDVEVVIALPSPEIAFHAIAQLTKRKFRGRPIWIKTVSSVPDVGYNIQGHDGAPPMGGVGGPVPMPVSPLVDGPPQRLMDLQPMRGRGGPMPMRGVRGRDMMPMGPMMGDFVGRGRGMPGGPFPPRGLLRGMRGGPPPMRGGPGGPPRGGGPTGAPNTGRATLLPVPQQSGGPPTCLVVSDAVPQASPPDICKFLGLPAAAEKAMKRSADGTVYLDCGDTEKAMALMRKSRSELLGKPVTLTVCTIAEAEAKMQNVQRSGENSVQNGERKSSPLSGGGGGATPQKPQNGNGNGPQVKIDPEEAARLGPAGTVLVCAGFPANFALEDVLQFFSGYPVKADTVRIWMDNEGTPTGDCMLAVDVKESAEKAATALNGKVFLGQKIAVVVSPS